jgi:hypothetical protein
MLQLKECLSRYIILSKSGKLRTKDHPQTYEQGTISKEHQGEVLVFKRHFKKIKLNSKRGCWAQSTVCCSSRETFVIWCWKNDLIFSVRGSLPNVGWVINGWSHESKAENSQQISWREEKDASEHPNRTLNILNTVQIHDLLLCVEKLPSCSTKEELILYRGTQSPQLYLWNASTGFPRGNN